MLVPFLHRDASAPQPGPHKTMFKWLAKQFTREEDDPESLGSESGLRAFMDGLPVTQPTRTVEAIGEPFENVRGLGLEPARMRRALLRLDERAQAPLDECWSVLFSDAGGRTIGDGPWLALARYYRNVNAGYRACLDALPERSAVPEGERAEAILIAARAMYAAARHKLLLRLRYRDVDAGYWTEFNALAAWADGFGGHSTLVELYPERSQPSSVEREYLIALMLEVAPIANLLPVQMHALDVLIRRFGGGYVIGDSYRDSTPFAIEPVRNAPPQRWLKGLQVRPGVRFFGTGNAYPQIASVRKQSRASPTVPEWLAPSRCDLERWRALLDLLVTHWSTEPPQRRQRRDRVEGEVLVVHGLAQVRRMVAASEYARTGGRLSYQENTPYDAKIFGQLRFGTVNPGAAAAVEEQPDTPMQILEKFELAGDRQMTERWTLVDVSESGVGALAHAHGGWAKVGMLIGYRTPESLDWQLALVRRLSRNAQGKLSIGLQRIPGSTHCARMRIGDDTEAGPWTAVEGGGNAFHDAILLRHEGTALLLDPGVFGGAPLECMLSFDRRWHAAQLERTVERGLDYERVDLSFREPAS